MNQVINLFHLLVVLAITFICWLPVVNAQESCNTETFEDGSAIKTCMEYREELPAICTYLYDEYGDLVFWDCSSQG